MEAYVLPACIEADERVIGKNHTKLLAVAASGCMEFGITFYFVSLHYSIFFYNVNCYYNEYM